MDVRSFALGTTYPPSPRAIAPFSSTSVEEFAALTSNGENLNGLDISLGAVFCSWLEAAVEHKPAASQDKEFVKQLVSLLDLLTKCIINHPTAFEPIHYDCIAFCLQALASNPLNNDVVRNAVVELLVGIFSNSRDDKADDIASGSLASIEVVLTDKALKCFIVLLCESVTIGRESCFQLMGKLLKSNRSRASVGILFGLLDSSKSGLFSLNACEGALCMLSEASWGSLYDEYLFSSHLLLSQILNLAVVTTLPRTELAQLHGAVLRSFGLILSKENHEIAENEWEVILQTIKVVSTVWDHPHEATGITEAAHSILTGLLEDVAKKMFSHFSRSSKIPVGYVCDVVKSSTIFQREPLMIAFINFFEPHFHVLDAFDLLTPPLLRSDCTPTLKSKIIDSFVKLLESRAILNHEHTELDAFLDMVKATFVDGSSDVISSALETISSLSKSEIWLTHVVQFAYLVGALAAETKDKFICDRSITCLIEIFVQSCERNRGDGCDVIFDTLGNLLLVSTAAEIDLHRRTRSLEFLLAVRCAEDSTLCGVEILAPGSALEESRGPRLYSCNRVLCGVPTNTDDKNSARFPSYKSIVFLDIDRYVDRLVKLLKVETNFEIITLVYNRLERQLQNTSLFLFASSGMERLREWFCEVISEENAFANCKNIPNNARKSDVYLICFRILGSLLSYRQFFLRPQMEELLHMFQLGLQRWPNTSKICVSTLTFALNEIPTAMVKVIPGILITLSGRTSVALAPYVLEFLSMLTQLPEVYINCTEEDHRRVFGIVLQYIHESSLSGGSTASPNVEIMYVKLLSHNVITAWFLSLKLFERRKYVPFIVKQLMQSVHAGGMGGNESVELVLDMLVQYAYSDFSPKRVESQKGQEQIGNNFVDRNWIQGNVMVSMKNTSIPSIVDVSIRRPSGIFHFKTRIENKTYDMMNGSSGVFSVVDPNQNAGSQLNLPALEQSLMDPSFIMMQLSPYPSQANSRSTIILPNDDATSRAIKVLDRIPILDLHKIGVVYIGPGQFSETDILGNTGGSNLYNHFLLSLGCIVSLSGTSYYTGGLDTENAIDGQHALIWENSSFGVQIVYHTATLMPTNYTSDPLLSMKKRHLGNDFVVIAYNDSGIDEFTDQDLGKAFGFHTLPGQFNYANIIVTPIRAKEPKSTSTTNDADPLLDYTQQMFSVELRLKAEVGLPKLSVLSEKRLVLGRSLAILVRQAALHANALATVASQTQAGNSTFSNNTIERLRQIKRIFQRNIGDKLSSHQQLADYESEISLDFTRFS
ncbi:Tuberous sclerosis 2-like protein [Blyttiomyces sp. JEL0837]|nr:Tuberous sclerosis 2-like protein [Blyttiomyces sp. JEL0837]